MIFVWAILATEAIENTEKALVFTEYALCPLCALWPKRRSMPKYPKTAASGACGLNRLS